MGQWPGVLLPHRTLPTATFTSLPPPRPGPHHTHLAILLVGLPRRGAAGVDAPVGLLGLNEGGGAGFGGSWRSVSQGLQREEVAIRDPRHSLPTRPSGPGWSTVGLKSCHESLEACGLRTVLPDSSSRTLVLNAVHSWCLLLLLEFF